MESRKIAKTLVVYSGMGLQLGITVFIFVYAGYIIDKRFSTGPLAIVLGTIAGVSIGIYTLIKEVKVIEEKIKKEKSIIDNRNKI